jgi:hypothetical protein
VTRADVNGDIYCGDIGGEGSVLLGRCLPHGGQHVAQLLALPLGADMRPHLRVDEEAPISCAQPGGPPTLFLMNLRARLSLETLSSSMARRS